MKVALIFLLCFVSLSYQQRWVAYPAVSPAGFFYQGTNNPYYQQSFNDFAPYDLEDFNRDEGSSDVEGRITNKLSQQSPFIPRSFLFPSRLWSSLLSFQQASTSTRTLYTSVTSTTTVVAIQSCISSNAFASAAPGGFSTSPCVRRRRDVLEDLIEKSDIFPSKVEPLVPTTLAVLQSDSVIPEIAPSLSAPNEKKYESRRSRAAVTVFVSTTSTLTSYTFATTTIKKFFSLAAAPAVAGAGALLCLPSGYTAC